MGGSRGCTQQEVDSNNTPKHLDGMHNLETGSAPPTELIYYTYVV